MGEAKKEKEEGEGVRGLRKKFRVNNEVERGFLPFFLSFISAVGLYDSSFSLSPSTVGNAKGEKGE